MTLEGGEGILNFSLCQGCIVVNKASTVKANATKERKKLIFICTQNLSVIHQIG